MIDRKALWISITVIFAMIAGGIWRLSLLPDWHRLPINGPNDTHTISGLTVLEAPLFASLILSLLFARRWFASGLEEDVRPWRRWSSASVIAACALLGMFDGFILGRSLGFGEGLDRHTFGKFGLIVGGILIMAMGNALPKLPRLSIRFSSFQLDPSQHSQHLRFAGKLLIGMGLFVATVLPLLPPRTGWPAVIGLWLAIMAAIHWQRARLLREPSLQ